MTHKTWVEFGKGNVAVCTCGWRDEPRERPKAARAAVQHAKENNARPS
jgi:hypothetical protein